MFLVKNELRQQEPQERRANLTNLSFRVSVANRYFHESILRQVQPGSLARALFLCSSKKDTKSAVSTAPPATVRRLLILMSNGRWAMCPTRNR
jgi:hypothetical protein